MKDLNDENFILFAAANYKNSNCYSTTEFIEDLDSFTYLKKLFSRYENKNELRERLILNHIIKIYNVFEIDAATRMLFYRIEKKHWHYLKTFLSFLNYMPSIVYSIRGENIHSSKLSIDINVAKKLKEL